ncbi:MAG: succinate dehydrogenase, cytochrome b556 subunit [Gammaproteobacteria bacterium]
MSKKDTRPVFINLLQVKLPITGVVSILHRITGFVLFFTFPLLVWFLDRSLGSESSYLSLIEDVHSNISIKLITSLLVLLIVYHSLVGIKKLLNEFFGVGETLSSTKIMSWSTMALFLLFYVLFIVLFWF